MKEIALIIVLLVMFIYGYFLMARLDDFLEKVRETIKKEKEREHEETEDETQTNGKQ